ncbi:hypothetical protein LNAOJCKE_2981 [Methylorubrum aminovorans]|uniref:Uncharacterized protein n=1 Tax=Methylorubrum aminovorans TaxID=269069 RepID=A0ABQ4UGT9_9HYPH|nr:hypothetical protein [Methylorubrum aminovorans]GJE65768.1 hypothetical protein LNAOJCKE_2981 [Methylorubrum aminovorans]GMA75879.1 hypothetical protein GCM10025880_22960 [Methylorubrum aminovorans]
MAFLNTLGAVPRCGQWRLRLVLRTGSSDGRLDLSEAGLIDFSAASDVALHVVRRDGRCTGHDHLPLLTASASAGTLFVSNPGIVEALFPTGWSACVPPGLYDVRVLTTVGPETALIFSEPVELR